MAKSSRLLVFLALASGMLVFVFWAVEQNAEPRYHGQPLSSWTGKLQRGSPKEQAEAREAMRALGSGAVPSLIKALEKQDSRFKRTILTYTSRFPMVSRWIRPTARQPRADAATALGEIGPSASNAIPALVPMSELTNNFGLSCPAKAALLRIRGDSIEPLLRTLDNPGSPEWVDAVHLLAQFGTNAFTAVPALSRALTSTNENVRITAAFGLGHIHSNARIAVPALINAINQGNLGNTIWALGHFEGEAKPAVPTLRQLLPDSGPALRRSLLESLFRILSPAEAKTLVPELVQHIDDPDPYLRASARNLLKQIDPEVLAKAGIK
jgi:HEAT repeat protein